MLNFMTILWFCNVIQHAGLAVVGFVDLQLVLRSTTCLPLWLISPSDYSLAKCPFMSMLSGSGTYACSCLLQLRGLI